MNNGNNTGSFGAAAGGVSPELQEAIQRRSGGNPSGPMGQVTATSPTFDPSTQRPSVAPQNLPQPNAPASQPTEGGLSMGSPESEIIIKALDSRLKSISKLQGA